MRLLVSIPQPYPLGLAHASKQGNRKKDLKSSDAFYVWLVTVKATFGHVDDNTFLKIIVTTVSPWIPDMDQKQVSDDYLATGFEYSNLFSALQLLIFLYFQFLSRLRVQRPAEQSHCQDQNSFLELHKALILPIQSRHNLPKTLKGTREDNCCSFQTPEKVKTCHLIKIAWAFSLLLMLFHHQRVAHKWGTLSLQDV